MGAQSEIRSPTEGDIEATLTLQRLEGWNQTERDWCRLLQLEPAGCSAAEVDGRVVGTVTTTTYGGALAWIGMMLVAAEHRRRGIGRHLFSAALDHLRASGISGVKLDATPVGRSLYGAFGFVPESVIERWETVAHHKLVNCDQTLHAEMRQKIHALDRACFRRRPNASA